MYKRLIAIPLCIIFCIAVFSFSVFAVTFPENNFTDNFELSVTVRPGPFNSIFIKDIPYGEEYFEKMFFLNAYDSSYQDIMTLEYTLTVPACDQLYIMCRSAALSSSSFNYSQLSSFYNSSGTYTDSFSSISFPVNSYYLSSSSDTYTRVVSQGSNSNSFGVTFLRFDNVTAGTYSLSDSSYYNTDPAYIYCCIGVFAVTGDSPSNAYDDYINGNISFSDALSNIQSSTNANINNVTSFDEKNFFVSLGQFETDRLVQASNDKNLSNIQNSMVPSLNNTVNSFSSGSASLEDSLSALNSTFGSSLDSAETPEQALLVSTQYQIALKKLELQAKIKATQKLDSAISDAEMSEFQDYYESESTLIESFEIEQFKSQIALDTWMLQLPSDEAAEYKRFFDYILNESEFRFFIIVPMCCGLIALVLGTRIRLSGRRESPHD